MIAANIALSRGTILHLSGDAGLDAKTFFDSIFVAVAVSPKIVHCWHMCLSKRLALKRWPGYINCLWQKFFHVIKNQLSSQVPLTSFPFKSVVGCILNAKSSINFLWSFRNPKLLIIWSFFWPGTHCSSFVADSSSRIILALEVITWRWLFFV